MQRTRILPNKHVLTVTAILHAIGEQAPYFSITAEEVDPRSRRCCGCMHDAILREWPDLADLVALHLSDRDGAPLHAEANGWYWLAGALGGAGEDYHGANGSGAKSAADCRRIFREHARISHAETRELLNDIGRIGCRSSEAREFFRNWIDQQRPRWKREADAAVEKYGLEVRRD